MKGQTLCHKTVSRGSKFVIFTSVKWQVIPRVLFSFASYSSASPLLVDLPSRSQQNASVCRNVCLPKGKMGPSESRGAYQHQLPRYPRPSQLWKQKHFFLNTFIQVKSLYLSDLAIGEDQAFPQGCLSCMFYEGMWSLLFQYFLQRGTGVSWRLLGSK